MADKDIFFRNRALARIALSGSGSLIHALVRATARRGIDARHGVAHNTRHRKRWIQIELLRAIRIRDGSKETAAAHSVRAKSSDRALKPAPTQESASSLMRSRSCCTLRLLALNVRQFRSFQTHQDTWMTRESKLRRRGLGESCRRESHHSRSLESCCGVAAGNGSRSSSRCQTSRVNTHEQRR
jgi:hypothetical protein